MDVHFVEKGSNVHSPTEQDKANAYGAKWILCVDQGSRPGPPLNQEEGSRTLIIDHHWSDEFPKDAEVSSKLLTYSIPLVAYDSLWNLGPIVSPQPPSGYLFVARIRSLSRIACLSPVEDRLSLRNWHNGGPGYGNKVGQYDTVGKSPV